MSQTLFDHLGHAPARGHATPVLVSTVDRTVAIDPAHAEVLVDPGGADDLAAAVDGALAAAGPGTVVAGAVPFRHGRAARGNVRDVVRGVERGVERDVEHGRADDAARLVVGSDIGHVVHGDVRAGLLGRALLGSPDEVRRARWRHLAGESPAEHARRVDRLLRAMPPARVDKAVLARRVTLASDAGIDVGRVLDRLARHDPAATVFAVPLADGGTFVGASPELLVERRGALVTTHPLAGSVPRHPDPRVDRERGERLLGSPKDLREHAYVVDDIVERLLPWCTQVEVDGPDLRRTERMWHLGSTIRGTLRDRSTGAARIALHLHPTPAVAGTPTQAAVRLLADVEHAERGYYAGAVGWQDADGDGCWAVAIRCARIDADLRRVQLYAGGGIVAGSDPAAEAAETEAKMKTMLDALEVD